MSQNKRLTMSELDDLFREFNAAHRNGQDGEVLTAVIVYKQKNFDREFSELERSYKVYSNSRRWQAGMIANSYTGDCLDGKDLGVRLDWYRWEVEYCYLLEE